MITKSIRRIPIIIGLVALMAALLAPQAGAAGPVFSFSFGKAGSEKGQFKAPTAVAVDSGGNVWVADNENHRVQKFNSKGEYLSQFGKLGTGNGEFKGLFGIAVDSGGNVWVADYENHRVQKFNSKGEYLSQFGKYGSGNGQFKRPAGIAIDAQGDILVADSENDRVQEFNSKGEYLSQFGAGVLNEPGDIAITSGGDLWVTSFLTNSVVKFNSKGEQLSQFGSKGTGNGQFNGPFGIAINSGGILWVTDAYNSRVQKFNSKGEYLSQFGTSGSGNGQFNIAFGIALDANDNIWVVDTGNTRVQRWVTAVILAVGGKPMSKGEKVFGTSGNTKFVTASGTAGCPSAELVGQVVWNKTGPALVQQLGSAEFPSICNVPGPVSIKIINPYYVGVGVGGLLQLHPDKSADLGGISFSFNFMASGPCKAASSGLQEWASGAGESTLSFNYLITGITGAGCPSQMSQEGTLKLTDASGTPIEILAN